MLLLFSSFTTTAKIEEKKMMEIPKRIKRRSNISIVKYTVRQLEGSSNQIILRGWIVKNRYLTIKFSKKINKKEFNFSEEMERCFKYR